jgi:hypothetical protein
MKAYGLKNKISNGSRKVSLHTKKGSTCAICNNYKVIKKSARQIAKREIADYRER